MNLEKTTQAKDKFVEQGEVTLTCPSKTIQSLYYHI